MAKNKRGWAEEEKGETGDENEPGHKRSDIPPTFPPLTAGGLDQRENRNGLNGSSDAD